MAKRKPKPDPRDTKAVLKSHAEKCVRIRREKVADCNYKVERQEEWGDWILIGRFPDKDDADDFKTYVVYAMTHTALRVLLDDVGIKKGQQKFN